MGAVAQIQFKLEKQAIFNDKRVNYTKYSNFSSVQEFNNQWSILMTTYKKKFTKPQLKVLSIIRRFAGGKFVGVCNASFRSISEKFEEKYGTTVSRDTWRTAVDKADKFGLLNKHDGIRLVDGRNSRTANVLIFNRAEDVKAYAIAKAKEEEAEIEQLLEQELARMTPAMNYAYKARKWAEEKAIKKAEQEDAARKKAEKEAAQEAKRASLYNKIGNYLAKNKVNETVQLKEMVAIAYGSVNKMIENVDRITKEQAEDIAYTLFIKAVKTKKVKKTHAALYSWLMNDNLAKLTNQKDTMTDSELKLAAGLNVDMIPEFMIEQEQDAIKRAEMTASNNALKARQAQGKEMIPDWWGKHKEGLKQAANEQENDVLDFEAEKKKFEEKLAKLRG